MTRITKEQRLRALEATARAAVEHVAYYTNYRERAEEALYAIEECARTGCYVDPVAARHRALGYSTKLRDALRAARTKG